MCFSATASFSLSAAAGVVGVAALKQTTSKNEVPLAAIPLIFGIQQLIEGLLWLNVSGSGESCAVTGLSSGYLFFAEVIWPAYVAIAVLLVEPERRRRCVLVAAALTGGLVSAYLLYDLVSDLPTAFVRGRSIGYSEDAGYLTLDQLPYLISTMLPLLISSHPAVRNFGVLVAAGFLVSAYVYSETFVSVWCFFAAASSVVLYLHFKRAALRASMQHSARST